MHEALSPALLGNKVFPPSNPADTIHYVYADCYHDTTVPSTILLIASVTFLIFTLAMACEQIEAIETGQGKIARMKAQQERNNNEFCPVSTEEFNEMFGGDSPKVQWHWFLPWVPVRYPRGMLKVVQGYESGGLCTEPYRESSTPTLPTEPIPVSMTPVAHDAEDDLEVIAMNSNTTGPMLERIAQRVRANVSRPSDRVDEPDGIMLMPPSPTAVILRDSLNGNRDTDDSHERGHSVPKRRPVRATPLTPSGSSVGSATSNAYGDTTEPRFT
jgi:hypothetical protein